jgi:hypothetical protein
MTADADRQSILAKACNSFNQPAALGAYPTRTIRSATVPIFFFVEHSSEDLRRADLIRD